MVSLIYQIRLESRKRRRVPFYGEKAFPSGHMQTSAETSAARKQVDVPELALHLPSPAKSSPGGVFNAPANCTMATREGFLTPRSIPLI